MVALPTVGQDSGQWGTELNAFLQVSHAADGTLNTPITLGTGDNLVASSANVTVGQYLRIYKGTEASPDTTLAPLVQINRVLTATQAAMNTASGDTGTPGQDILCGLKVNVTAATTCDGMATGILAVAHTESTQTSSVNDAVGIQAWATAEPLAKGGAIGVGTTAYRFGNAAGAFTSAIQTFTGNLSGTPSTYSSTDFSGDSGIAVFADFTGAGGAPNDIGVGIQFLSNYRDGTRFDVGIGFPGHTNGSFTGAVKNSSIRDDGNSAISLDIEGQHATGAIYVKAGTAGNNHVGFGVVPVSSIQLFMIPEDDATMGIQIRQHSATQAGDLLRVASSVPAVLWSVGPAGHTTWGDAVNMIFNTGTGTKIGTGTTQKIAFYNSTPVIQQSATGGTVGFTTATGGTVLAASTFTGGTATTAYTINGIVAALKTYGLLAP